MVDTALLPAITETIRQNEIGNGSPYVLSFAQLGKSGASFGFMQGDTNASDLARSTLQQVLEGFDVSPENIDRIEATLGQALPNGNPLSDADTSMINTALGSVEGRALVDQMDHTLMDFVLNGLDSCIEAAGNKNLTLAPITILYIAPWINMSGKPTLLNTWLDGNYIHGVPPPAAPIVDESDIVAYLQAMGYFQAHPRNFTHFQQCVDAGARLLPP